MKSICVFFITFYQRWISPIKGFTCAHHVLHGEATCSNAVKSLILEHGLLPALPLIRNRFDECRTAFDRLQTGLSSPQSADLPCDLSCDPGFADCGGSSTASNSGWCFGYCGFPGNSSGLSKKTERVVISITLSVALILSYVYYGRDINSIYITDLGGAKKSFVSRLFERDQPQVRVLILVDGQKFYTEIVKLDEPRIEYKLLLDTPISTFDIDRLEILDARLNIASKLVVVGQVLEVFERPANKAEGIRFSYRFKRRWHFY